MIMEDGFEEIEPETESNHSQSDNCDCAECRKNRNKYVSVLDIDRYIESLNDWD